MLKIPPRSGGKKQYRYGGSGIFDSLTRKLFSTGMKNVINTAAKSAITQKVANAVVNGATSTAEKAIKEVVNDTINHIKQGRKRKHTLPVSSASEGEHQKDKKAKVVDINSLINGSGIVLD